MEAGLILRPIRLQTAAMAQEAAFGSQHSDAQNLLSVVH